MAAEVSYNNAWYTFGGGLARKNVATKNYIPFGEQNGEQTSGFGYNGEYYNAATGMIYLRARFYEPEMNRFSQKDTLRGSMADGVSLNRYLYCKSDPVNFADYNGRQMVAVNVADGGGGGKKTTTSSSGSTTPRAYTNTSQPKVYSNSYQEYQDQRRNAVTPNPQEYAMLRQTGYSGSFSQYASNKTHTQFPSYPEYMQGKAMGNPYYVTYNNGKPTPVAFQRAFYTNNQSNNTTSGISRDAPEVYDVTGGQYSCGRDIRALGASDYPSDTEGALLMLSMLEVFAGGALIATGAGAPAGITILGYAVSGKVLVGAGGVLIAGGVASETGGIFSKITGGSFESGWAGGQVGGLLTGFGLASGSLFGVSAVIAEGISIGLGGFGGIAGSAVSQYLETGEVDFNKALKAGIVNGITSGFAGVFGHVPGSILFASGVGAIEKVVGIVITLVNEIIADSSSAIISNGGN